jgi:hypothetical protein
LAGTAPTLKTLPPYYLNLAKSKVVATVQEYEMAMLMQEGQGATYGNKPEPTLLLATNLSASSSLYHTSCSTTPSSYTRIQSPPEPPNNRHSMLELTSRSTNQQQNLTEYFQAFSNNYNYSKLS